MALASPQPAPGQGTPEAARGGPRRPGGLNQAWGPWGRPELGPRPPRPQPGPSCCAPPPSACPAARLHAPRTQPSHPSCGRSFCGGKSEGRVNEWNGRVTTDPNFQSCPKTAGAGTSTSASGSAAAATWGRMRSRASAARPLLPESFPAPAAPNEGIGVSPCSRGGRGVRRTPLDTPVGHPRKGSGGSAIDCVVYWGPSGTGSEFGVGVRTAGCWGVCEAVGSRGREAPVRAVEVLIAVRTTAERTTAATENIRPRAIFVCRCFLRSLCRRGWIPGRSIGWSWRSLHRLLPSEGALKLIGSHLPTSVSMHVASL